MFTAPAPAYVDICIWRESLFPLQLEFYPLLVVNELKTGCVWSGGPDILSSFVESRPFFYTWILMHYLNTPTSISLELMK